MTNDIFLKALYEELDGNIEVREITKAKRTKKRHFFKSVNELKKYNPPKDANVYIGIYSRQGKNGTAAGCLTTKVLWADYDYKSTEEVKEIIRQANIPKASILVSSGYGIHAYWVLKKRYEDEAVNLVKAIQMRTGADPKAAEKARILRLPGSLNIKHESAKECKIIEFNNNEYSLNEFKTIMARELQIINKNKIQIVKEIKELKNCSRACIKVMAKGTVKGHRNFALCKITKWLQLRGYTRRAALDVIRRWNTLNNPPKPDNQILLEFNKVWETDYKLLGCNFKSNKALQEQCEYFCCRGECKHATIQEVQEITSDDSNKIDNLIFKKEVYSEIKGMDIGVYFTIAKTEGITKEYLAKVIGVHKRNKNFIKAIDKLQKLKLVQCISGNKRDQEKDLLILNNLYNEGRGYTIINNLLSEVYFGKRITDTEYKLLVLLKSYSYMDETVYPTIATLASKMGKTERTITSTLKKLQEKLYIKNSYTRQENGSSKIHIKLLF